MGNSMTNRMGYKITKKFSFLRISPSYITILFIFLCSSLLSGCVGLGRSVDCNVESKGRCASMDKINNAIDQGMFDESYFYAANAAKKWGIKDAGGKKISGYPIKSFEGSPIRSGESVQQIWIAPYEDSNGDYHDPSYVYTVVKGGRWLGDPVSAIQD